MTGFIDASFGVAPHSVLIFADYLTLDYRREGWDSQAKFGTCYCRGCVLSLSPTLPSIPRITRSSTIEVQLKLYPERPS